MNTALLDFTEVPGACNQYKPSFDGNRDCGTGSGTVAIRNRLESGQVQDREIWLKAVQRSRNAQQVTDREPMPSAFEDNANPKSAAWSGARLQVLRYRMDVPDVGEHIGIQSLEVPGRHRLVALPPDRVCIARFPHDELVPRGPASMRPSIDEKRTVGREDALAALQREFNERRLRGICGSRGKSTPRQAAACVRFPLVVQDTILRGSCPRRRGCRGRMIAAAGDSANRLPSGTGSGSGRWQLRQNCGGDRAIPAKPLPSTYIVA